MATPKLSGYFPARPVLTAPLVSALLVWAGCAIAYGAGGTRTYDECLSFALPTSGLVLLGALLAFAGRRKIIGIALASIAVGALLGWAGACNMRSLEALLDGRSFERAELVLEGDSRKSGFYETAVVSMKAPDGRTARLQATFKGYGNPLLHGSRIEGTVRTSAAKPGGAERSWGEGVCCDAVVSGISELDRADVLQPLRNLRAQVIEAIGAEDDAHALLQALVCGYRRNLNSSQVYESYKACGLAHLVAVSGAHLVIVTSLFASLFKTVGLSRRVSVIALVAIMVSYLVLSGFPVSAIRATIMSSVSITSLFARRRPSSVNALGIGVFLIIAANPSSALSVSFSLSALSTLGIVVFGPLFIFWLEKTPLRRAYFIVEALALTFASNLLSLPYSISLFSILSFVAPVANVACAPLFPLVCSAGLVAGVLAPVPIPPADLLVYPVSWLAGLMNLLIEALSAIPYAAVPAASDTAPALMASALVAGVLWAWWPKPDVRVGASALVVAALFFGVTVAQVSFEDSLIMLDVGQGDAILVRSQGKTLLVDTGNQDSKLLRELGRNHVVRLDGVLITHADDDHYGSMDVLSRYVRVGRVIVADGMVSCTGDKPAEIRAWARRMGAELVGLGLRDGFDVGGFRAETVWPASFREKGGNADSVCLMLRYGYEGDGAGDFKALMTGDAEKDEVAEMIERGLIGEVDVLKVGHHGSRNGTTAEQMRVIDPQVALISCGLNNRYGHPTEEILAQLDDVGCSTFRTDRDGEVRCALSASGFSVEALG